MQGWIVFSKCVRHSPSVPSGAKVEAEVELGQGEGEAEDDCQTPNLLPLF